MEFCTECGADSITETTEYFECDECGAQFELDSDPDDPELVETDEYDW